MFAQVIDSYIRQARLAPALIVILPAALLLVGWFPTLQTTLGALCSLACTFGIMLLLSQVARDRGKNLEPQLFKDWGGKPSVAMLRHVDARIDVHTKADYRRSLEQKILGLQLPTADEENISPQLADEKYEAVTQWLLTKTRDTKKFKILFQESVSYGFRRNLLGLKPFGVAGSLIPVLISSAAIAYRIHYNSEWPSGSVAIVTVFVWIVVLWWILGVRAKWVEIPAEAYGFQLLAAIRSL